MKIVIVGNGVAGITCAMTARQRDPDASITVISGETDYYFSRTALMYSYMDIMTRKNLEPYERGSYAQQRINLIRDWVTDMDANAKTLTLESGKTLHWDRVVFAVGASPNMFPWKGADAIRDGKVHFVSMQDLDECERLTPSTREAVVVGGGLIGIELVECLLHHGVKTTFLIREPYYWPVALGREEADYVAEHMREHGADVRLGEEMTEIQVDGNGRVSAVVTNKGETIPCQMLGIAAGVRPNIARLKGFKDAPELGRGIIVNDHLETNIPGVFACGDCAEIHPEGGKPYGELIWYSAKRQGALVGRNLFGDKINYTPPLFFNSSKFFEIEYTTVGEVMNAPEGSPTIYRWSAKPRFASRFFDFFGRFSASVEHTSNGSNTSVTFDASKHKAATAKHYVSQRIVHDGEKVLGFNMLGSRWNHEILERWIHERRSPEFVLKHLSEAQYDVEFGRIDLHKMVEQELPLRKEWP